MTTITITKLFDPEELGTSLSTLYTVPSTPSSNVLRNVVMVFANTTGAADTIDLHAVPNGGTAGDSNAVVKGKSIAANETIEVSLPDLDAGGTIQALAGSANTVTAHARGGHLYAS